MSSWSRHGQRELPVTAVVSGILSLIRTFVLSVLLAKSPTSTAAAPNKCRDACHMPDGSMAVPRTLCYRPPGFSSLLCYKPPLRMSNCGAGCHR